MAVRTEILSVHKFRRNARKREHYFTGCIIHGGAYGEPWPEGLPEWAKGVRVRKAGAFQYVVEATNWTGH